MRTTMQALGFGLIFLGFGCKDASKFDRPHPSTPKKESTAPVIEADDDDAEAAQALEPIAIGGAYLACRYEVVTDNGEVWCRLEENAQPLMVDSVPTLENWIFTQDAVPFDVTPYGLDRATGWQWGIKIPKDTELDISLDIFLNDVRYHFNVSISSKPPADDSEGAINTAPPVALDKRYAYGNNASFVVDNYPFSLLPPESCVPEADTPQPDPMLPNLSLFFKAHKFTFPFKVVKDGSLVSITVDEICGQTRPIHFADLRSAISGKTASAPIPIGAKTVNIIKSMALPAGDYEVEIHYVPRSILDLQVQESIAFGKLILESSGELIPGRAFGN